MQLVLHEWLGGLVVGLVGGSWSDAACPTCNPAGPILEVPDSSAGLRRRKREWVIPPISLSENLRGVFPKEISKIKSSLSRETKMVYSITGEGADQPPVGLFTVNRNNGSLYVTKPLDREAKDKYVLQVHAVSPDDYGVKEVPMEVIVTVIDQNDNKPIFTQNPFLGSVPEASAKDFEFMTVTATDADDPNTANADIRYSIISQNPQQPNPSLFDINPVTGGIRVKSGGLDRENYPEYTLLIQAADLEGNGLVTTGTAVITVTDSNDNAPQFEKTSIEVEWVIPPVSISENNRGPYPREISQIKSSLSREIKMVFGITGEGADQPPVGLFTVNRNLGWLFVTKPLDREAKDKYVLQVHAISADGEVKEAPMEIIVNVIDQNDNKPVFTHNPFLGSVPEAAGPGFEFMTVTATDADDPNTANADIRYSIISQNPQQPNPSLFDINPVTGGIRVKSGGLDRENFPEYTLLIKAADLEGNGLVTTGTAVITVTDSNGNAPQFEKTSYNVSVPENKVGAVVVKLPVTDGDEPQSPAWSAKFRIIGGNNGGFFNISTGPNKQEGIITTVKPLNFEQNNNYTLLVVVENDVVFGKSHLTSTATVIVNVEDVNEAPVFDPVEKIISKPKDLAVGTELAIYTATDPDRAKTQRVNLTYRRFSNNPSDMPDVFLQRLAVDEDVSEMLANGTNSQPWLNHEEPYPEDVAKATDDTQGPVLELPNSSAGLRRRKREWVIPPISFSENDRGPYPKEMVQIKSSHARETKMVYSISDEGADQPPVRLFAINRNTGWLFVTKPLDREAKDKYVLQVHAISADGEVKEAPMEVIVNVIDQNDNKPVFTQNPFLGSVPEAAGFEFMTVTATDADDPNTANADIRYSIIRQNPQQPNPSLFDINPVTGGIRVKSVGLDRENYPEYTLLIQAADLEGNGLVTTGTAVITVTDSNDNAPHHEHHLFQNYPEYTLLIQAADLEGNGLVTTGTAVITVTDSNDNAPQFEKTSYSVSVPENKAGAVVVKLPVTDGDEPQSPAWSAKFRIVSGNNGGFFNISTGPNKQEGIITTVKPLDFELNNKYTLLVAAENDLPFINPLTTSTAMVIVNVQDVNEAPVFDPVEKIISKPEDLAVETELTVYTATDPDTAKTQTVIYGVGADPADWLRVDKETGLIRVRSPMDRESPFVKDGKYKVLILAVDDDPVPATGTGTLVINMENVTDNAPVIEKREIRVCNKESTPVLLSVTDGPGFAAPYSVQLQEDSRRDWTARMDETKTGIILTLITALKPGEYNVVLRVYDTSKHFQDNTVQASVRDCTGDCPRL
ncbi:uncharacterized protein [Salminus brasiliensis]|uniref:uncharacterized protein n=1 Tax=Salminus brasiliensis TaxID=930266 RepID=UPI003B8358CC